MGRDNNRQAAAILSVMGVPPVIWLALLVAPSVAGGLPEIIPALAASFNRPFAIELCEDSLKTVLVFLLLYGMGIGIYFSTRRNYRRREEHGSAKWGEARVINKKYQQSPPSENKLMTQNVKIGLNAKKHRRNLNTLVCGGSGAGKTRFYCKPNLMQANTSFVILDPKGEILRDTGYLLEKKGYEIRVLDLISMEKSHCYNPFVYLQTDNDVQRLVTNLFKSTTPKGAQSQDPFWDTAGQMLLLALIFYLKYEAPPEEQNFPMVMEMLRAGAIEDEEDNRPTPLDNLFGDLEIDDSKKQLLSDIFWEMNEISSHTETSSETVLTEIDDGEGNIIETEATVTTTTLYITVSHKTVDEMAAQYGFTQEQKDYLAELLKDENNFLWAAVLYGIGYSDDQIVAVALSQLGNYGGMPYWSWYGFGSRVEWCACFVSWCANECGYIDNGIIPKYAGCVWGVQWFKDRGQWMDGDAEPVPGMIIFFDWDDENGQDGESDHTGIVEKVEDGIVYTVEGNSGDHVAQREYSVGYYEILGYGVPQY